MLTLVRSSQRCLWDSCLRWKLTEWCMRRAWPRSLRGQSQRLVPAGPTRGVWRRHDLGDMISETLNELDSLKCEIVFAIKAQHLKEDQDVPGSDAAQELTIPKDQGQE